MSICLQILRAPALASVEASPTARPEPARSSASDSAMFFIGTSFSLPKRNALKEGASATSGAPTDRGFPQRETGMDQETTPEANIIGLLGKKKKPWPKDTPRTGLATARVKLLHAQFKRFEWRRRQWLRHDCGLMMPPAPSKADSRRN